MPTKTYITAIRLSIGQPNHVRHIEYVWHGDHPGYSISDKQVSTIEMVRLIDSRIHVAYVRDPSGTNEAEVIVVRPGGKPPYLRTVADGDPNDNLLKLPKK